MGMGSALAIGVYYMVVLLLQCTDTFSGGAGLLGGALLENAWDDHEENIERESYDDGVYRLGVPPSLIY